jgi:hypothetical protein
MADEQKSKIAVTPHNGDCPCFQPVKNAIANINKIASEDTKKTPLKTYINFDGALEKENKASTA